MLDSKSTPPSKDKVTGQDIFQKIISEGQSYDAIPDPPSSRTHDSARSTVSEASEVDEDFVTLDWALHEEQGYAEAHRRAQSLEAMPSGLRAVLKIYDAMQGWIALTLIGCATGLLAALVAIGSEWAADLKFGYCYSENGFAHHFWITRKLCCKHTIDDETCPLWRHWHEALGLALGVPLDDAGWGIDYACYILVAILQAVAAARICVTLAPYAAGSGITELKVILGGFVIKKFLGAATLVVKSVGLIFSVGSGLGLGKEGPFVHLGCCVANIMSRAFGKYRHNESKKRELLSCAAAAGVAVAFGAPVGGVLFSLEMLSSYFPPKTIWRSFYCAIVAAITLRGIDPLHSGKLVAFEITYHYAFGWFEMPVFVMLGAIGGLVGTLMLKLMVWYAYLRKSSNIARHPVYEVGVVAAVSASATYLSLFLRMDTTDLLAALYSDCKYETNATVDELCVESEAASIVLLLLVCAGVKLVITVFGTGTVVPGGHMVPSMAVGACLGRVLGFCLSLVQESVGDVGFFAECAGHDPCITPGVYAIIGSAAMLSAVSRMTVSLVVIIFELTDGIDYIMPSTICILVAKWVSDAFGRDGIYDELIVLNGYPHLNTKMDFVFTETAQDVMKARDLSVITLANNTIGSLTTLLSSTDFSGYPIVKSLNNMHLVGYISRANLVTVLEQRTEDMTDSSPCFFLTTPGRPLPRNTPYLDFSSWLDQSPIQIVETTPLNRVIDTFRALRLRYVVVVRNGALVGIATKRDILRRIHTFRGSRP